MNYRYGVMQMLKSRKLATLCSTVLALAGSGALPTVVSAVTVTDNGQTGVNDPQVPKQPISDITITGQYHESNIEPAWSVSPAYPAFKRWCRYYNYDYTRPRNWSYYQQKLNNINTNINTNNNSNTSGSSATSGLVFNDNHSINDSYNGDRSTNSHNTLTNTGSGSIYTTAVGQQIHHDTAWRRWPVNPRYVGEASKAQTLESSPPAVDDPNTTFENRTIHHNAYLYDVNGRVLGKHYVGDVVQLSTGVYSLPFDSHSFFYETPNGYFVKEGNVNACYQKLKHNAYAYNKKGKRANRRVYRKGNWLATYGSATRIKGKYFYPSDNWVYFKKANFR